LKNEKVTTVKLDIKESVFQVLAISVLVLPMMAGAQELASSHATSGAGAVATASSGNPDLRPVVRVNGTVLTEHDLMREMYTIFPYASQHNGIPQSMEPAMRRGALDMIVFEELLYQEALRRKMTISPERLAQAEGEFREQFPTQEEYDQVLKREVNGSQQLLRKRIQRALLIEDMLKIEVEAKSRVSEPEAKAYYDKNPKLFEHPETFRLQTISILPPVTGGPEVQEEARRLAQDAIKKAKATKTYREFGLLAEKVSDDDWHVNMGDRKSVTADQLPPEVLKAARALKPGEVSDLMQLGNAYTIVRLVAHVPAGRSSFDEVQDKLREDMEKTKYNRLRAELDQRLRRNAKVEEL
jgi:parvulin-like peptidyl-prolyl isomerase